MLERKQRCTKKKLSSLLKQRGRNEEITTVAKRKAERHDGGTIHVAERIAGRQAEGENHRC
jgi:hypothetical protein